MRRGPGVRAGCHPDHRRHGRRKTWEGSVSGLVGSKDAVFVRACNGANRDYAKFTVSD